MGQGLHLDRKKHIFFIIACVFPDFDSISLIGGFDAWHQFHRGPVHSFPVILLASLVLMVIYHIIVHPPRRELSILALFFGGMSSHLILDLLTPWKIPVLWPFSGEKISYNLTFFFDIVFFIVFFIAVLFMLQYRTQKRARVIMISAILLVSINFGVRYYERNTALDTIGEHEGEIIPMPTLRLDRWWIFVMTPSDSGYSYDIYEVDSFSRKILSSKTVESLFTGYKGSCEPPIDSPEKAVAYSRKDKTVKAYVDGLYLPAVTVSHTDGTWTLFWYDVSTEVIGNLSGGISVMIDEDGTILEVRRVTQINIQNDLIK